MVEEGITVELGESLTADRQAGGAKHAAVAQQTIRTVEVPMPVGRVPVPTTGLRTIQHRTGLRHMVANRMEAVVSHAAAAGRPTAVAPHRTLVATTNKLVDAAGDGD